MAKRSQKRPGRRTKADEALDRPFDPEVLARAQELARKYRIVLEPDANCGYVGSSLELPNVFADGPTPDDCVEAVRDALTSTVAYLLESGGQPPLPPEEQTRTKQVNIRLTEAEQRRLKEAAKASGYSDMSDFVRSKFLYS